MILRMGYHFVRGVVLIQNRDVNSKSTWPHYALWLFFKMATAENNHCQYFRLRYLQYNVFVGFYLVFMVHKYQFANIDDLAAVSMTAILEFKMATMRNDVYCHFWTVPTYECLFT